MDQLEVLASRVAALERQNRRLRRLIVGVIVAAAAGAGVGAQVAQNAVIGERFALVDATGRARATLEIAVAPQAALRYPMLTFLDAAGKPRLRIGLGPRGATMETIDEHGKATDYFAPAGVRPLTQN